MEPVNALLRLGEGEFEDLFPDVEYGQVTEYAIIEPGRYTMDVQLTNGEKRVLWVPNINLRQGRYYSIYMIGQGKEGENRISAHRGHSAGWKFILIRIPKIYGKRVVK